jgi:hypothetical protein
MLPTFVEETATSGITTAYTGDWQYMVGGGAAVFDRSGAWMGLLAQPAQEPRRIAGVIPQAAWRMASAEAAVAFLSSSGVKLDAGVITAVEKSAGEVAGANASALVAVSCQR